MRGKRFCARLFFLALLLVFAGSASVFAQGRAIKLRYSVIWPATHPITKLVKDWGADVEKATAGRVTVTVFPGSTLSPPMQVYDNT